jgi:ATP-binding protein involved in chromosome partitioning
MRIAIPVDGDRLADHFGHCQRFILFDIDPSSREATGSIDVPAPEHQPGLLPVWLQERGVNVVIARNMGNRASSLFEAASIEVLTGAPIEPAMTLVQQYLEGTLVTAENDCHHHHHGHNC